MARTSEHSTVAEADAGVNQSAFIRQLLTDNPQTSFRDASNAWESEHGSPMNSSLFYQVRSRFLNVGSKPRDDAPNRSEFIRKNLEENPNLSATELSQIWKQDGFPGELKASLYYQVKRRMGKNPTRKVRGRKPGRQITSQIAVPTPTGDRETRYSDIEVALDRLIRQADELGDPKLTIALRQARRHASAALV